MQPWSEHFLNLLSTLLFAVTWKGLQLWLGDMSVFDPVCMLILLALIPKIPFFVR